MKRHLWSVLPLSVAAAVVAMASPLKMQPGLWEDEIAAPDGAFHTEQKCYLRKDIDNIEAFQKGALLSPEQSCRASGFRANGDTISYTLTCKIGGTESTSQITATYAGTTVSGSVTKDGNVTRLTRRRIGDCSKSSISP